MPDPLSSPAKRGPGLALSPLAPLADVRDHWHLVRLFTLRDALGRYRGSVLGLAWSFLSPLLMLAVFTIAFGTIMQQGTWTIPEREGSVPAVLAIFTGMIVFGVFGEVLSRAPALVVGNPNYVKKVVFPLEILPVTVLGSALLHASIGVVILLVGQVTLGSGLHPSLLWLPVVAVPLVLLSLGIGWLFASLGVYVRDLAQSIVVINQALFFLTPVVYPRELLTNNGLQALLYVNPIAPVVDSARRVILFGVAPSWLELGCATLCSAVLCQLGYAWFRKTREGFADVV